MIMRYSFENGNAYGVPLAELSSTPNTNTSSLPGLQGTTDGAYFNSVGPGCPIQSLKPLSSHVIWNSWYFGSSLTPKTSNLCGLHDTTLGALGRIPPRCSRREFSGPQTMLVSWYLYQSAKSAPVTNMSALCAPRAVAAIPNSNGDCLAFS